MMSKIFRFPRIMQAQKPDENTILLESEGYGYRATRKRIGTLEIIVIDVTDPDHDFYGEAMLWILGFNFEDWMPVPLWPALEKWKTSNEFLMVFPEFKELFTYEGRYDPIGIYEG